MNNYPYCFISNHPLCFNAVIDSATANALIGRTVMRYFIDPESKSGNYKAFYGTVTSFCQEGQFFRVDYTDGDCEDLSHVELMWYLQPEGSEELEKYKSDEDLNGSGGCGGCGGSSEAAKAAAKAIQLAKLREKQAVLRDQRQKRRADSAGLLLLASSLMRRCCGPNRNRILTDTRTGQALERRSLPRRPLLANGRGARRARRARARRARAERPLPLLRWR